MAEYASLFRPTFRFPNCHSGTPRSGEPRIHSCSWISGPSPLGCPGMTWQRALGGAVAEAALVLGAMGAAKHPAGGLDAVADDLAAAMGAGGRHRLDRAFEAVEGHRAAGIGDLEGLVVIIAADIACRHRGSPEMPLSGK